MSSCRLLALNVLNLESAGNIKEGGMPPLLKKDKVKTALSL